MHNNKIKILIRYKNVFENVFLFRRAQIHLELQKRKKDQKLMILKILPRTILKPSYPIFLIAQNY